MIKCLCLLLRAYVYPFAYMLINGICTPTPQNVLDAIDQVHLSCQNPIQYL